MSRFRENQQVVVVSGLYENCHLTLVNEQRPGLWVASINDDEEDGMVTIHESRILPLIDD